MQKFIITTLSCIIITQSFAQKAHKSTLYLQGQYNHTISDVTRNNNPWGIGLGLQLFGRQTFKLKPTIDLTADVYLMDDKVLRIYPDGTPIGTVRGMVNVFAGLVYQPGRKAYLSIAGGPAFVSNQTLFGIKPSLGFYLSSNQKLLGKICYLNIFNREKRAKQNFGSVGVSLGVKLF